MMFTFNAGAQRPAPDDVRAVRLAAANDLVQRTLAQHGLLSGAGQNALALPQQGLPSLRNMLSRLDPSTGATPLQDAPVPHGAEFRQSTFTCAAGTRSYRTYVPSKTPSGKTGVVVMLHGCTQTPEDFAAGTGMNALAETHGFVVVYPRQSRGDNAQSCWNWFSRGDQHRDRGEPAILAGLTREVMAEFDVPPESTFVAGLSAGGAMAVNLAETYPDVFAAVGVHSGLPFGAAKDVPSAFAAMAGNGMDPARRVTGRSAVRAIVIHGSADPTVHPSNGHRIARDMVERIAGQTIDTEERTSVSGRNLTRKITSRPDGVVALEQWIVEGLGHAWSGGTPAGSYTDPSGPDASAGMIRFFFEIPDKDQ